MQSRRANVAGEWVKNGCGHGSGKHWEGAGTQRQRHREVAAAGMTSIRRSVFDVFDGGDGGAWQPTKKGAHCRTKMGVQQYYNIRTEEARRSANPLRKHGSPERSRNGNGNGSKGKGQPLSIVANCRRFRCCHHYLLFSLSTPLSLSLSAAYAPLSRWHFLFVNFQIRVACRKKRKAEQHDANLIIFQPSSCDPRTWQEFPNVLCPLSCGAGGPLLMSHSRGHLHTRESSQRPAN